jgi:hypothetical protein
MSISVQLPPAPAAPPPSTLFIVASVGEPSLDPCGDNGGNLVGVADRKQVICLHGVLLPYLQQLMPWLPLARMEGQICNHGQCQCITILHQQHCFSVLPATVPYQ